MAFLLPSRARSAFVGASCGDPVIDKHRRNGLLAYAEGSPEMQLGASAWTALSMRFVSQRHLLPEHCTTWPRISLQVPRKRLIRGAPHLNRSAVRRDAVSASIVARRTRPEYFQPAKYAAEARPLCNGKRTRHLPDIRKL